MASISEQAQSCLEPRGLDWRTVKTDYCRGLSEYEREPGYLRQGAYALAMPLPDLPPVIAWSGIETCLL